MLIVAGCVKRHNVKSTMANICGETHYPEKVIDFSGWMAQLSPVFFVKSKTVLLTKKIAPLTYSFIFCNVKNYNVAFVRKSFWLTVINSYLEQKIKE